MNKWKLIFLGQGKTASKTLTKLSKNTSLEIIFCAPRLDRNGNWFDGGIFASEAENLGIQLKKNANMNDDTFVNLVKDLKVHLIVNLGHNQLFRKELINSSHFGILNYHPGLLPYGRGSGAAVGEIINGAKYVGRTCHLVDEHFDRGVIVNQEKFEINIDTTLDQASQLLQSKVDVFIEESVLKTVQSEKEDLKIKSIGFGRYFPKFALGDDYVDWNDTSINIYNKIRSRLDERFSVIYTRDKLERFLITRVELAHEVEDYISVNGQVIDKSKNGVLVKTSDYALWLTEIFDPISNQKMTPDFKIGTCFQTINISDFIGLLMETKKEIDTQEQKNLNHPSDNEVLDSLFHCPNCGENTKDKIIQSSNKDDLICMTCNFLFIP
jgi:methionyl-tRNA formyltransferase